MAHSINELKVLKHIAPRWFVWTGGPDQTEDPEWINDALAWGIARIENEGTPKVQMHVYMGDYETIASPGDVIVRHAKDELYAFTPSEDFYESAPPSLGGIVEETGDIFDLIIGFADNVEELAFRIPAPNEQTPQFVTYANAMRFIARKRRDTLRANLKQEEWQDISTAPKDGTRILINEGNEDYPEVVYWDPAYGEEGFYRNHATAWVNSSSEQIDEQPTHWKPLDLPTTPQSKKEV